ncbi:MAG TPA: 5'-3' exonuclease H3TH domain-containing protein, partial [Egibacteraceae bacterium]
MSGDMETLSLFDTELRPAVTVEPPSPSAPAAPRAAAGTPAASGPTPTGPVLLAVDGNSLAHRAFHAYTQPRVDGSPGPGGRYGFLAMLSAICDRVRPDALVVGFDCRATSVRRERYAGYKAQRPDQDPRIPELLDDIAVLLDDLGVLVVQPTGWEADDVLGSAAAAAERAGWRAVLATSDRDAYALVSDTTTVLRLRSGLDNAVEVTPRRLRRDVGVAPWQYTELAALRGDTSDNLPGIPGIGTARAAELLSVYPTVADAAADPLGCRSVLGRTLG